MKAFICNYCGFCSFPSLVISLWYLWWNCKNLFFNCYSLFGILVAYFKASSLSLVPLVICVMHLIYLKFIYIQWDKFELCAMLLSSNLVYMFMTSFWIPCSLFPEPFRMYMFLCGCISSMVCLIRNLYIWNGSGKREQGIQKEVINIQMRLLLKSIAHSSNLSHCI